jgi:hypothetical protein
MTPVASSMYPEIARLQQVMQLIEDRLDDLIARMPARQRALVPNALLNLAVERVLAAEGAPASAWIVQRLADLIHNGDQPNAAVAFRLTGHDA